MKRIFALSLGVGAVLLLLAAQQGRAQVRSDRCADRDTVVRHLQTRFGETRHGIGLGGPDMMVELFASDETGTWTLIVTSATGVTCMVAAGESWQSVTESLSPPQEGT